MNISAVHHEDNPHLDLFEVGEVKAIGYLQFEYFRDAEERCLIRAQLAEKGVESFELANEHVHAVFAFARASLQQLLTNHQDTLRAENWPTDPEAFMQRVVSEVVSDSNPVYDIIALAYGNNSEEVRRAIHEQKYG